MSSWDDYRSEISQNEGVMIDIEGVCYTGYRVKQFALDVADFSSQYGSSSFIYYNAHNVIGRPRKFPQYGDFPETFSMRTYGEWWDKAPSRVQEIQSQNLPPIPVQDYIVVYFEDCVIPEEVMIFETFNPGALVGIWAYTLTNVWVCLWKANELCIPPSPNKSRLFSPKLTKTNLLTRTIRLEFNHTRLNYLTEIDGVRLVGKKFSSGSTQRISDYYKSLQTCPLQRNLKCINFKPNPKESCLIDLKDFSINEFKPPQTKAGLNDMPPEIMLNIFNRLDLATLFRVGQVSKKFHDLSKDPSLYKELNLKPYWHSASTDLLRTLAKRATRLKKLDLSWCGLFDPFFQTEFIRFITKHGGSLTHLRLNSCRFLNVSCIEILGIACDNLKELSLRNFATEIPLLSFSYLKNLERLDLSETKIGSDLLLTLLKNNRQLKHLNLAFCSFEVNMDDIAQCIGQYNKQLISLDMWKSHYLSYVGLQALSQCYDLEEVDFGWCLRGASLGDSLKQLLTNCTKLKKLFLTAVSTITNCELENIAKLCANLEQLDLMGISGISPDRYFDVLFNCKKLKLLDLSFCDTIDEYQVAHWARIFNVDIKFNQCSVCQ